MARLNTIFKYDGTFNGVTSVRSKTYGDHVRAGRGTKKVAEVNDAFKESAGRLREVNQFAKVIKDALDLQREVFRDGTFWSRLLSLLRRELKETGKLSWQALEGFELMGRCSLGGRFRTSIDVDLPSGGISIHIDSQTSGAPEKVASDEYEETVVVVFLSEKECIDREYHTVLLPVASPVDNEHSQTWPIPAGATTAVVVLGCSYFNKGKRLNRRKMRAMKIAKVVGL